MIRAFVKGLIIALLFVQVPLTESFESDVSTPPISDVSDVSFELFDGDEGDDLEYMRVPLAALRVLVSCASTTSLEPLLTSGSKRSIVLHTNPPTGPPGLLLS